MADGKKKKNGSSDLLFEPEFRIRFKSDWIGSESVLENTDLKPKLDTKKSRTRHFGLADTVYEQIGFGEKLEIKAKGKLTKRVIERKGKPVPTGSET